MDIAMTGRNLDLDKDLKGYISRKVNKFEKLYKRIYKCEVILEEEKERKNAEIILFLKRSKLVSKESSTDIYASIDSACESIKKQLRRLNGKMSTKRRRSVMDMFIPQAFKNRNIEDVAVDSAVAEKYFETDIIKTDYFAQKPLLPEEAKYELETIGRDFIMFKNSETGEVNVLFKRAEGGFGLIEPRF